MQNIRLRVQSNTVLWLVPSFGYFLGMEMGWEEVVRDLIFLSREGKDLGVAFQAPPGSQASSKKVASS